MSMIRFIRSAALMGFALSMIGGKSCFDSYGDSWANKIAQRSPEQKPYCMMDPPYLCAAVCNVPMLEGEWTFTDECNDISADAKGMTTLFKATVMQIFCDPQGELVIITPSGAKITPLQVESSDACMPPPPW
jgi:hypothetical protein